MAAVEQPLVAVPDERRTRRRVRTIVSGDRKQEIINRVLDFYDRDWADCAKARDSRLQRTAKFRGWVEGKTWPWENASDVPLTDLMEKSLRVQDTLHNAVMSQTPPVGATALQKKDKDKVSGVDNLINFQVFTEQPGEEAMGDLIDAFTNDGEFTVFIPWVKEKREASFVKMFDPIPNDTAPAAYFSSLVRQSFPSAKDINALPSSISNQP